MFLLTKIKRKTLQRMKCLEALFQVCQSCICNFARIYIKSIKLVNHKWQGVYSLKLREISCKEGHALRISFTWLKVASVRFLQRWKFIEKLSKPTLFFKPSSKWLTPTSVMTSFLESLESIWLDLITKENPMRQILNRFVSEDLLSNISVHHPWYFYSYVNELFE